MTNLAAEKFPSTRTLCRLSRDIKNPSLDRRRCGMRAVKVWPKGMYVVTYTSPRQDYMSACFFGESEPHNALDFDGALEPVEIKTLDEAMVVFGFSGEELLKWLVNTGRLSLASVLEAGAAKCECTRAFSETAYPDPEPDEF